MPAKAKRKTSGRKPLVATNGLGESPQKKTIEHYFPPSPPTENNNHSRLKITSETVFYNGPTGIDAIVAKNGVCMTSCLLTPEDSPEKADLIKSEPSYPSHETVLKDNKPIEYNLMSSASAHSDSKSATTSDSHTSSCVSEDSAPHHDSKPIKSQPTRRGRKPKPKVEEAKPNHLLTEFFPVRKSSRKTAKALVREQEETYRNKILDQCEDGLKIVEYPGKGRGIEATKTFSKGDFIVEYAGDLVELQEAKSREENYKKDTSFGCYMYFFLHKGKSYCVDATIESGKLGRLLNHSKLKPNCMTRTIDVGDIAHLILVAARDIEVGEELVYDYGDRSKEAIENNPWLKE